MPTNGNAISLTSENYKIFLGLIQLYTPKGKITVQKATLQCAVLPQTIVLTLCNLLLKKLISPFFVKLILKRPWKEQLFIYSNDNKMKCIAREEGKPIYVVFASLCYYRLKRQCCLWFHQIPCACMVQVKESKPTFPKFVICVQVQI